MNIWLSQKWRAFYDQHPHRTGLRVRYEKGVDPEVRRACMEFFDWLRSEYEFPMRVVVYIKACEQVRCMDGELAYGTFFRPFDRLQEPYVRIATGDYEKRLEEWGKDSILTANLKCIAHELTHYFQWLNDVELTPIGEERSASYWAQEILYDYAETREHP